jgi:predicted Zn-dependent protease
VLGPSQQAEYGAMTLSQLRHYGYILDDPLLEDWVQSVGHKLAANSDKPRQSFTFFLMKDRQINAFATLAATSAPTPASCSPQRAKTRWPACWRTKSRT